MSDFVDFNLAKKLKEKGFYYRCVATYDKDGMLGYNYVQPASAHTISFDDCLFSNNVEDNECIDAPTISQVLKWLRDTHKFFLSPCVISDYQDDFHRDITYWSFIVINIELGDSVYREYERVAENRHDNYEQAAIGGIEYVLDNLI